MKIFLDTANVEQIKEAAKLGLLDGVTTNPTLIAKEKRAFEPAIKEICEICPGPVSAECVAIVAKDIVEEGKKIARIASNVVVKVPLTMDGLQAVRTLTKEGIKVNVTLCFSAVQAMVAAKSGATYISPFIGRLDDAGQIGMDMVKDIKQIYSNYRLPTQIIVASIRHPLHVLEAAKMGADIATMPYQIFTKLFVHPLTDDGIAAFLEDWKKVPKNL